MEAPTQSILVGARGCHAFVKGVGLLVQHKQNARDLVQVLAGLLHERKWNRLYSVMRVVLPEG